MCLQGDSNLKVGQSFDNVLAAAQQVVIIASGEFEERTRAREVEQNGC